jgi:hypothetical protein
VKVLYINLDSRPDRVTQFLADYPDCLPAPERLPAVRAFSPHHGCWLSHRKAAGTLIDCGAEWGLVLEDDAFPREGFDQMWPDLLDALPGDWQFCYLAGYYVEGKKPRKVNRHVRVPGGVLTSHSYLIRRSFLATFHEWLSGEPGGHVDHYLKRKFTEQTVPGYYCATRQMFGQRGGWSDIEGFRRPADLTWQDPEDMRDIVFRAGQQSCDQDADGRCRRLRCGRVKSDVCRIGVGTVRVEVPEV